ncbi:MULTISPECIES: HU family DNA-binding protein [unclassified Porphyromonas]|uniref:HU family DNA-binding protein n=1 Tax=unclassified Porphyromonas TaxID=2645799 RepID=UPI00052BBA18|nr:MULTISPECIES: HU family DNA-binding protein [unclassified Porphyromonas]KGN81861.1 DNA-binding protein [Porphyromonas sp. COT-290 OH860]KGN97140.1 DNA-binding protein [Porphyromonas sp. COT-290 OH3588]
MNKTEFIARVAEKAGLTKVDAQKAVNAFADVVAEQLKKGDKVALLGFGTFSVNDKPARTGINPKTKEKINIPARKAVKFKPGSALEI